MLILCKLSTTVLNSATLGRSGRSAFALLFMDKCALYFQAQGRAQACARCRKGPPSDNIWKFLSSGKLDVKELPFVVRQGIPSHRT
jgi:hypothetical protein